MKDTIGIIGQGFVGSAVREGLKEVFDIETYDKFKESTCNSIKELCEKTKIIFVCLPTPMRKDGTCDLSIVRSTVLEVDKNSLSETFIEDKKNDKKEQIVRMEMFLDKPIKALHDL